MQLDGFVVDGRLKAMLTCFLLGLFVSGSLRAVEKDEAAPQVLAPGWAELEFDPPAAGSYRLPPLGVAGDGDVVDGSGQDLKLHSLMGDKIVVMSFIYSSCSDANGCPLATHVLARLKKQLRDSPGGTDGIRFISLSFDPSRDTPEVMRNYGSGFADDSLEWWFLTTTGSEHLVPILASYGQSIVRDPDSIEGEESSISHVLRVYLIDRDLKIRNIYSASYLHADTLFNDIRTLQDEAVNQASARVLQGPGDDREGYERADYRTRAQSLQSRQGLTANLMGSLDDAPLGLPPIPAPPGNPVTKSKAELGRLLFFDRRLSHNNTFSCAMCHVPEQGFTSNELATAVGIEGRTVRRNSPTIYNVAYMENLFHDGRETLLERQIWGPLLAHNEMGNPSPGQVIGKIESIPEYRERFMLAFDGRGPSMETVGMALASYERLLVSANSPFDRWYYGKQADALTAGQQAGFRLFTGKAGCSACHLVSTQWALFMDNGMHNTGIGYYRSMSKTPAESRIQVAPGEHVVVNNAVVADASEPVPNDLGLYEITGRPEDRWKYRTPSLRNVSLTAPYMHDGSISTLEDVVRFYNRGGIENELLDPLVHPLGLSETEMQQLVEFLEALTGANVDAIVADAYAVPVGNPGSGPGQN